MPRRSPCSPIGTQDCEPVDIITGPGNVYVAAAKRLLRGLVSTDGEAGPTEIAIIADADADASFLAADLIAQAEHDSLAACLLISTDAGVADRVDAELARQLTTARHASRIKEALTGQSACVLVDDLGAALAVADTWAPEHLEIQAAGAAELALRVRNAGAVFVGPYAPVSLGDYLAGSNHVLPTGGTARHTGGLVCTHVPARYPRRRLALSPRWRRSRRTSTRSVVPKTSPPMWLRCGSGCRPARTPPSRRPRRSMPCRFGLICAAAVHTVHRRCDARARLNTNENPYSPSAELVAEIAAAAAVEAAGLNRYPDRDALALRGDLASYLGHGLTAAQVWAANGSNEIIQQLFQAFGGHGRSAVGFEPSYSMHPIIAKVTGTDWIGVSRAEDFGVSAELALATVRAYQPDLVFLTSPNNPTGTAVPLAVIEQVCQAATGMVVIDEAYVEFARDRSVTALSLLPSFPRLVVVRTMSKAFALAGGRIGYFAADSAVVDAIKLVRLPYHLSALTQAVARAALARSDELQAGVAAISAARDQLVSWLKEQGLKVADSDTNFILFGEFADRHAVWQALLDRGVLIREVGPPGWLRVSRRHRGGERPVQGRAHRGPRGHGMTSRTARVSRATKETQVEVELDLDGTGSTDISTGVPFFDHMLGQLGKHGCIDLRSAPRATLKLTRTTLSRTRRSRLARRCARRWATRRASAGSVTR